MKYTSKSAQMRLAQIDDEICKLMEEAEHIKNNIDNSEKYNKEEFENLLNTYENASSVTKDMFLSYVIDTHDNLSGLFL